MFCINCGKKISSEYKYCTNCGYENRNYNNAIGNKPDVKKDNKNNELGYFKKHWKGELPLSVSFWINNAFLYILLFLLLLFLEQNISIIIEYISTNNVTFMLAEVVLYWLLIYLFFMWTQIGLWRSATKHITRHNKFLWAYISKIIVVIIVVIFVIPSLVHSIIQIVDYSKLAFSKDNTPNYKIELQNNNTKVKITGGIKYGLTNKVKEYFIKYPNINTIILNSAGGSIYEARALSKFIKNERITTFTTKNCSSACVDIFMAGKQRILQRKASLGFHQVSYRRLPNISRDILTIAIDKQKKYYLDRGVNVDFVEKAFTVPGNKIWYPSHLELIQAGVVDKVIDSQNLIPNID